MKAPAQHETWRSGFSLVTGGPFYHLLRRLRVVDREGFLIVGPSLVVLALAFAPVLLMAAVELAGKHRVDPLLMDFSVLARFVVAVPFFFAGERLLHVTCTRAVERIVQGGFAGDEGLATVERALRRAVRLRDLRSVEVGLGLIAVIGGQAALWRWTGFAGYLNGGAGTTDLSFAQVWYGVVALPIFQFLMARWLWRWLIWSLWLLEVSRLRMQLVATHPDGAGGIGSLADPTYAFAFFASGASSVVAGAWATRLAQNDVAIHALVLPAAVLGLVLMALAFGPLLSFWPNMARGRYQAVREYGRLAITHARLFHHRWIERPVDDSILGSPDISSLADLQSAYQEMAKMRTVPFGRRPILAVATGVIVPMLPLLTFEIPVSELLVKIGGSLLGVSD